MATADLIKKIDSEPMFGAGATQPSLERNFQTLEWRLPSGERLLFETSIFQLDGQNPYAIVAGPMLPMYRVLEIKKKRLIGWKTKKKLLEYSGAFAILNALIRTTSTYEEASAEGRAGDVLVEKRPYEHARFGNHEYFDVAGDRPAMALTELVSECGSIARLLKRIEDIEREPDEVLAEEQARLADELEKLRAAVLGSYQVVGTYEVEVRAADIYYRDEDDPKILNCHGFWSEPETVELTRRVDVSDCRTRSFTDVDSGTNDDGLGDPADRKKKVCGCDFAGFFEAVPFSESKSDRIPILAAYIDEEDLKDLMIAMEGDGE